MTDLQDPKDPSSQAPDQEILNWLCQSLAGDLTESEPPPGKRILDLLRQAVDGLPQADRDEFYNGIRKLKSGGGE